MKVPVSLLVVALFFIGGSASPAAEESGQERSSAQAYYPPSESSGGWRRCQNDDEVRNLAGMDPGQLKLIERRYSLLYGGPSAVVIIRRGYLAGEWFGVPSDPATTFDVWSCTKSATSIAFGMLFEDSRNGKLPGGRRIDLDSPVYSFVPEGRPLTDPRKERMKVRHLLTMSSGIPGEAQGLLGVQVRPGGGPFEIALGLETDRSGVSAATLFGEPGEVWSYSDQGFAHLAMIFANVTGRQLHEYMTDRVFEPIGIENFGWNWQGGGGKLGPYTNAHSGLRFSARDFARLGYLMLRGGVWKEHSVVPSEWVEQATKTSQQVNPLYGYGFWVNTNGEQWPGLPRDAFAFQGFASNRCYVIPSLDLVVVRLGYGPIGWSERSLLPHVVEAVVE